jgi:hypothetical protein
MSSVNTSLLLEWLSSRTQTTTDVGKDVREKRTLMYSSWEFKPVQPHCKTIWRLFTK